MSQIVTATFEDGILKPDGPIHLPANTRVRVTIDSLDETQQSPEAWKELERLWNQIAFVPEGDLLTRDQLHERR
jgi:predicted DNA-binding antitoxin AbrB/MazE fold protein